MDRTGNRVGETFDAVVIGAGHNGLTCAGYLARAGLKVKVLERRGVVGGAAVTEEFHPGFRNSVCSYAVSLLNPTVHRDLELEKYGLRIVLPEPYSTVVLGARDSVVVFGNARFPFMEAIRAQCPQDAERIREFESTLMQVGDVLRDVVLETPPNVGGGLRDLWRAGKVANRLRKLDARMQHEAWKLFTMSIADYLKQWFGGDLMLAIESYRAIVGNMQSVYAGGSAYVLLHHVFGEVNGQKGRWGHAMGGMGAITQAMARSAEAHGAQIEVGSPVKQVVVENGRVVGVTLEDGRVIRGRIVAANVNPKLLFQKLVDERHLDRHFVKRIADYRCVSGTFRMNVALTELPQFECLKRFPDYESFLMGSVFIANSLEYNERAYLDAVQNGWSREPVIQLMFPSLYDDSLAPQGSHVASLFCQHFNPNLPDGRSWDDVKEQVADLVIDTVDRYAPNFRRSVIGRMALSPLDLERTFGLIGGDIFHGCLHLDQLYSFRPTAGHADYRMPLKGLYLCGSGAHPGGGVSGCPGHNAAREILHDIK